MKKIYLAAFFYLVLGLVFGVFYREFTVLNDFTGNKQLSTLHTHTLVLGTFFFLIVLILDRLFSLSNSKSFSLWFLTYNIGLGGTLATMLIRGMGQVLLWELPGFNHIAGLFHTIIGVALVWFFILFGKKLKLEGKDTAKN